MDMFFTPMAVYHIYVRIVLQGQPIVHIDSPLKYSQGNGVYTRTGRGRLEVG